MDTAQLREQTAEDHARVEQLMPLMAQGLDRGQYASVLLRLFGFVRGWELWAERAAPPALRPLLHGRRRSPLLAADLRFLGLQPPAAVHQPSGDTPVGEAAFLGRMYVVEGSTLGGQYIARHVTEQLHLPSGEGNSYFRGYGEHTGSMWNEFKSKLQALPDDALAEVSAAARQTFRDFESWMVESPEGEGAKQR